MTCSSASSRHAAGSGHFWVAVHIAPASCCTHCLPSTASACLSRSRRLPCCPVAPHPSASQLEPTCCHPLSPSLHQSVSRAAGRQRGAVPARPLVAQPLQPQRWLRHHVGCGSCAATAWVLCRIADSKGWGTWRNARRLGHHAAVSDPSAAVLEGGSVLEKAAANISVVAGVLSPERAKVSCMPLCMSLSCTRACPDKHGLPDCALCPGLKPLWPVLWPRSFRP